MQDSISGLEFVQKATEELASPSSTHENNPLSVRKRKARHRPSTSQGCEVEDSGCEIRTLILAIQNRDSGPYEEKRRQLSQ